MVKVISRIDRWIEWKSKKQRVAEIGNRVKRSQKKGSRNILLPLEEAKVLLDLATKQVETEKPHDL